MRKTFSFVVAAALLASSSAALAADESEGALPPASPMAAQTQTVQVPGFGSLSGAQVGIFAAMVAAGISVAVAFAAASSASSTTI